jgi:hypothetical protein
MGKGSMFFLAAALVAGPALTPAQAQERQAPAGAVVVRPVQVREVRVEPQPYRGPERPTFGAARPVDPFISRPVERPQLKPIAQRRGKRHGRVDGGYGSVIGYPVIYPYAYPYDPFTPLSSTSYSSAPVPNTYSNVASLPYGETITAATPVTGAVSCDAGAPCGGLSFDITPASAQVWVDGLFVGDADEFDSPNSPLVLAPGDHYIEVRLAGYRTASFDVSIVAGEVTPYRGALERLRLRRP